MLIHNTSAAPAIRFTSDGAPAAVATLRTETVPEPAQQPAATPAQVQHAVDSINRVMRESNANVEFSVDKDTKQAVVKVVESGTGVVIRQFPSEDALAISRVIGQQMDKQIQRSLLVNQKA